MASYSEASLGLPWRTAALDRLLWQDEGRHATLCTVLLFLLVGVGCTVCGCPTMGLR